MSQAVLHVIAEDRQEPHVKSHVQPPRMKEHGADERQQRVACGQRSRQPRSHVMRYQGKLKVKISLRLGPKGPLEEINSKIQYDQKVIDKRRGGMGSVIADGNHLI